MAARLLARRKCFRPNGARAAAALAAGVLVLLGFVGSAGGAGTATTRVAGIAAERLGTSYPNGSGYGRYSYVAVGIADAEAAGALDTTSLVYTSGTSVPTTWTTGVD